MSSKLPLKSQPGSFWIGASLVAEVPFAVIAQFLSDRTREAIVGFVLSGPVGIVSALAVLVLSFLATAWLAHKAGLGV